ncbi:cold-shock protein [Streptomyces sp. 3N207]|uniref:cold-shock protein n=1 Tax=Streptomyces sp. 3N207 TaxID=3457417 RepID=UPI003FCF585D
MGERRALREPRDSDTSRAPDSALERRCRGVSSGAVKWFSRRRRWGVIAQNGEGEPDVIVHSSAILGCCCIRGLRAGDKVIFDVTEDSRGTRADNVRRVGACR